MCARDGAIYIQDYQFNLSLLDLL